MAVAFRRVSAAPLRDFDAAAPDGALIGIIGETGAGKARLLRLAAGADQPETGAVERSGPARFITQGDLAGGQLPGALLLLDHTFASLDAFHREKAAFALEQAKRAGGTILLVSHEEDLLERLADEIWWLDGGKLAGRGDPGEILAAWRRHIARRVRAWGATISTPLAPRMRRGDGRAAILRVETLGEAGRPTAVWRSGELAVVKVVVRFAQSVADPVIGIMIRTGVGLNVYGTNTELEKLRLGPRAAGDQLQVTFAFRCELCPQEYTLTVASHDPDGVWHDWLEDAVAFAVADSRYTAGVANLRANVSFEVIPSTRE
jgi:energy-coupling factor transporter ATP-binding protein EcfA2